MKKNISIGAIVIIIVLIITGVVVAIQNNSKKTSEETPPTSVKKKITLPVNTIPVSDRPYLSIKPSSNGRNITITAHDLKIPASELEYELEYQAGTLLQGAFGSIELSELPSSKEILLGSCSAGGACTYHDDVKGGTLLAQFSEGEQTYALKQEWKFVDNSNKETAISSKDAKFQLTSPEIGTSRYLVVYNSPGHPEGLEGTVVSEIYSLETANELSGKATLTIRAAEEGDLSIVGFNGQEWQKFQTTVDGKSATAEVELMTLYTVVK